MPKSKEGEWSVRALGKSTSFHSLKLYTSVDFIWVKKREKFKVKCSAETKLFTKDYTWQPI